MTEEQYDVIVIGAGPAGLTTAYQLASKSTLRVLVLESDPEYVGGISRTVAYNGFRFDIGGHRFFSKSEEINTLWHEILPDGFIERPRKSRIFYGDRFYDYPLNATQALANLGPWTSAKCVLSYLRAKMFPIRNPRSFRDWVVNNFGERLFEIFFKTYTEKVWGMSCDEISANWAAQRIKGLSLTSAMTDALRRSFRLNSAAGRETGVKTLIGSFKYPELGPGMMWDAAAEYVTNRGTVIEMGTTVTGLVREGDGWRVTAIGGQGGEVSWTARQVVSSAPLRDIVTSVSPLPRSAGAAEGLKYRDFLTVVLMFDEPAPFDDNWIYVHDPSVKVGRIQNFSSWSPKMVPDPGKSCLGLEYFCFEGDELWTMDDGDLVRLAERELASIGLCSGMQPVDGVVVRQPKAYPVYDEHYVEQVESVRSEFAEGYPGLHFVGRNGMHKYNNQDHAMMTGILTAENILAGQAVFDVWAVNSDAEYQEEIGEDRLSALSSLRRTPEPVGE